ncbi:hypothetical protein KUCAC02_023846 [Chaenocephalus aceratus]|uniref:Uncharacterized protein n=1 Tax=Chaenocephalus aceratus TaxID=36190 RepID=A0ACB9WHM2_CHAAC|nr:hypothetical protein KUCAC02_023846 [Chaenocephalus aceratus]
MHPEKCLPELVAEKKGLDPTYVHAVRLLAEEIEKYEGDESRKDGSTNKYLDIISNKNIKLSERVLIPIQQYPKFNFVGKLLGPRGNSMKRLQEETGVKMSILGKGSMRDKGKEEELRKSEEAKYAHLSNDLHVLIEVFAPPGEAYSRMSHALEEIKKFLVPDYNDEIRQEQLRELSLLNGSEESSRGRSAPVRSARPAATISTGGHRGTGRSAAAPRGTASRDARQTTHDCSHEGDWIEIWRQVDFNNCVSSQGYDDGYGGEYDDDSYEAYEENYSNQAKSISEYYEYGHGNSDETYNNYEQQARESAPRGLKIGLSHQTRSGPSSVRRGARDERNEDGT